MKEPQATRLVKYPLYTVGDLSSGIYAVTPSILLMFYMTNVLGISVALATIAAALPKVVDLISSPLVGGMSDNTSSRFGRRRPYLLFAGVTIFPAFCAIWFAPFKDPLYSALFIIAVFSICAFCYSTFLVPYCALNCEIATDYHDGTILNSWRAAYSMSGCLLAGAGAPLIVEHFDGGRTGYLTMGATMGGIMAAGIMVTFFASKEPPRKVDVPNISLREILSAIFQNRPFSVLLAAYFVHVVGSGVISAALAYYVTYVLRRGTDSLSLLFLLMFAASVVAIPIFVWLGKRFGKFVTFALSIALAGIAVTGYGLLDASAPFALALLVATVAGASEGGVQVFAYSMLVDSIKFGDKRRQITPPEAALSGVFLAGEKLGYAVGAVVAGLIFTLYGLVETNTGFVDQPASALAGIKLATSIAPALLNAVSFAIFCLYRQFDRSLDLSQKASTVAEQEVAL
ncbi:Na+/melibiose symporter [Ralstonia sp. 25mfcol4.1]|uniref:MFS transporter n=1 Tax=Ralstonia sp. 25mfcol4.1 TaxID=1761899 RepID=UPI0003FA725C|nr:MFS transporter [Ralstonia sp. 25mfcol4.1]SDP77525.1 Na+/melibiose symporter [Ralstonia sp. 25mfcol4.1]